MEDEFGLANELALLASNIRMEVCGVQNSFFSFLMKYEEKIIEKTLGFLNARS
jgi:hypothetical protein